MREKKFRAGFVTLLGRPNVGKSSLLNKALGDKVTMVSPTPQTTRKPVRGILTTQDAQIVFVDTPGLHQPKHALGEYMMDKVRRSLEDVDCICLVLDAVRLEGGAEEDLLWEVLEGITVPLVVALNKIDLLEEDLSEVLKKLERWQQLSSREIIPVSAKEGRRVEELLQAVISHLPEGPPLYPEDMFTDQTERFMAEECIREKIFVLARDEVPHSTAVMVEEFQHPEEYPHRENVYIRATVYVERPGQKAILIGDKGGFIKDVGVQARKELEKLLGYPVYLELWVKVRKNWRKSPVELRRFGYDKDR
ncbi:MAG TPA: GTPase Era [Synergistaceae bacterium]|nr:GTPase Era [Synergistaceae bacterium]HPJ26456.1 GTPase Era [Synergistaceae bacterium]HPQ37324.1 GTPase Era [Synergistaceae bacterium]